MAGKGFCYANGAHRSPFTQEPLTLLSLVETQIGFRVERSGWKGEGVGGEVRGESGGWGKEGMRGGQELKQKLLFLTSVMLKAWS